MHEEEDSGLVSVIVTPKPFIVSLSTDCLEGIEFEADTIETEDKGYVDFYLDSNLVVSVNRDKLVLYLVRHNNLPKGIV